MRRLISAILLSLLVGCGGLDIENVNDLISKDAHEASVKSAINLIQPNNSPTLVPSVCSNTPLSVASYDVYDSFSRTNNNNPGVTEIGNNPWIEYNSPDSPYVSVSNQLLLSRYFAPNYPSNPQQNIIIGKYLAADIILNASIKPNSENYNGNNWIGYRLPEQTSIRWTGGYILKVKNDALELYAGGFLIAEVSELNDFAWHNYQIEANGDQHCIYKDGVLKIGVIDATYKKAGYAGFMSFYSMMSIDDVGIVAHPNAVTSLAAGVDVYDDFRRLNGTYLGNTPVGNHYWIEASSALTLNIEIQNNNLFFDHISGGQARIPSQTANVKGYSEKDIEILFRAKGDSGNTTPFGISYRMEKPLGNIESDGYHLRISFSEISLYFGTQNIATYDPSSMIGWDNDWHDYKIVAAGPKHRVYIDGLRVIDVTDSALIDSGYVGIFSANAIVHFDSISINQIKPALVYPNSIPDEESEFAFMAWYSHSNWSGDLKNMGFNVAQTTEEPISFMMQTAERNANAVGRLWNETNGGQAGRDANYTLNPSNPNDFSEIVDTVNFNKSFPNLAFWEMSEEFRPWVSYDMELLDFQYEAVRQFDTENRPTISYFPNHYSASALEPFIPFLDVVAKGTYVYSSVSHAWVRYQVESTVDAIYNAGYEIGRDYPAQRDTQKTPMFYLLCVPQAQGDWQSSTFQQAYHDVYSGIASGALGVAVWSFEYAKYGYMSPGVEACREQLLGYSKAAKQLTLGSFKFGSVVLYGDLIETTNFAIIDGPNETESFTPFGEDPMTYPCLNVRSWDYKNDQYILAVNSCEEDITASISTVGGSVAEVLYENGRTVPVANAELTDTFEPFGVHIYKINGPFGRVKFDEDYMHRMREEEKKRVKKDKKSMKRK